MGGERCVDVLVVGGGPAGIAAAMAVRDRGMSFLLVERGADIRSRDRADPTDIGSGVGGAGLFSDGKFSFYPSATELWNLAPEADLREAYRRVCQLTAEQHVEAPPFPDLGVGASPSLPFESKTYESKYMSLESRYALVERICSSSGTSIRTRCSMIRFKPVASNRLVTDLLDHTSATAFSISSRALVVATGRLGPLLLQNILPRDGLSFRRVEVGFRIEQPADRFFLRTAEALDPKRIWRRSDGLCEWRTFCCCRNGEVVSVLADGVLSISGRSDVAPTGYSSVGLHARITEPTVAAPIWNEFRQRLRTIQRSIAEPLPVFLEQDSRQSALQSLFGNDLAALLKEGLHRLLDTYEEARIAARLHAPAVEGVLYYPRVDEELRLATLPVWVVGDACGLFRGITAALVSGYFSGIRAASYVGTMA